MIRLHKAFYGCVNHQLMHLSIAVRLQAACGKHVRCIVTAFSNLRTDNSRHRVKARKLLAELLISIDAS